MIVLPPGDRIRLGQVALPELGRSIVQAKEASPVTYAYVSLEALLFELDLRSRIVESARALYASGVKFATYTNSRCNEAYWLRTAEGGSGCEAGWLPPMPSVIFLSTVRSTLLNVPWRWFSLCTERCRNKSRVLRSTLTLTTCTCMIGNMTAISGLSREAGCLELTRGTFSISKIPITIRLPRSGRAKTASCWDRTNSTAMA